MVLFPKFMVNIQPFSPAVSLLKYKTLKYEKVTLHFYIGRLIWL